MVAGPGPVSPGQRRGDLPGDATFSGVVVARTGQDLNQAVWDRWNALTPRGIRRLGSLSLTRR